jgi:hypothetical protein
MTDAVHDGVLLAACLIFTQPLIAIHIDPSHIPDRLCASTHTVIFNTTVNDTCNGTTACY